MHAKMGLNMNRRSILIVIALVTMLLAACGNKNDESSTDTTTNTTTTDTTEQDTPMTAAQAEAAMRIRFSANSLDANRYFCPAEQTTADDAATFEGAEIHELSCAIEQDGIAMRCSHRTTLHSGIRPQELDENLVFRILDNKLCTGIFGEPE